MFANLFVYDNTEIEKNIYILTTTLGFTLFTSVS